MRVREVLDHKCAVIGKVTTALEEENISAENDVGKPGRAVELEPILSCAGIARVGIELS